MITRNDCLLLLGELKENGIDISEPLQQVAKSPEISVDVLKFIVEHTQLDVINFYEKIRKSYNAKKSNLYINIVRSDENQLADQEQAPITLSALLTQILLFSDATQDRKLFLKHARASEISKVLHNYFITYDLVTCMKLLTLIKADLKVLQSLTLK